MKKSDHFIFNGYRIGKIDFRLNEKFEGNEDADLRVTLSIEQEVSFQENSQILVSLICKLFDEEHNIKCEEYPFSLKLNVLGSFTYHVEEDKELMESFLRINAPAVIFPYLRAAVSNIVGLAGFKPIVLPLINFTDQDINKET